MDSSVNENGFKIYNNQNELLVNKITSSKTGVGYQYQNLQELTPCTLYNLTIIAYNDLNQSLRSKIRSFRTLCDTVKLNPPKNLGVYHITSTSARMSFYDDSNNEDGFIIYNHGQFFKKILTSNKEKRGWQYINFNRLNPNIYYSFTMESFSNLGIKSGIPNGQSNGNFRTKKSINFSAKVEIQDNLTNADVIIFKIEDNGTLSKFFKETTDAQGVFDAHENELDDNRFYIYQASGGVDSKNNIDNNGTLRAIVKGSWLKTLNKPFIISLASEMSYIFMKKDLKYDFNNSKIADTLQKVATTILTADLTNDNNITAVDLLVFSYKNDITTLNSKRYTTQELDKIVSALYKNQIYKNMIFTPIIRRGTFGIYGAVPITGAITKAFLHRKDVSPRGVISDDDILKKRFLFDKPTTLSKDTNKLFKLEKNSLVIFDNHDKANPIEIGRYMLSPLGGKGVGITLSKDEKEAFIVVDVTYTDFWTEATTFDLIVLDISNDGEINYPKIKDYHYEKYEYTTEVKKIDLNNTIEIVIQASDRMRFNIIDKQNPNNHISTYTATYDFIDDMLLSKDKTKLILATGNRIEIVDISDIYNPTFINSYNSGELIKDVILSEDNKYIYIANYIRGFLILNISNLDNIKAYRTSLSNIYYPQYHYIMNLVLSLDGKSIFLSDSNAGMIGDTDRLIEIDISNPEHPAEVARFYRD